LKDFIEEKALELENFNKEFFKRVWSTNGEIYTNRLRAIRFENLDNVLDAGFGFGQWTIRLANLNNYVQGIELEECRVKVVNSAAKYFKKNNLDVCKGSISYIPFKSNFFDGIFCYSAIYFTDYQNTLDEFFRVLKPGGKLYFCTNDLGWYLYNFIEGHNPSKYFSQRQMALETFWNSLKINFSKNILKNGQRIVTKNKVEKILKKIGYSNIIMKNEGGINLSNVKIQSFYPGKKYGLTNVYEVLCEK